MEDKNEDHSNPKRTLKKIAHNYTPIKCQLMMWKIRKTQIRRHTNGSPNLGQKTRSCNNQQKKKKKKTCKIVDSAVPADHRITLKECKKRIKYLDFARELKKLWNMKVAIIPIVIGAFCTVTKELLRGLEDLEFGGRVETIQTTALLKMARILRRVLETWGDLLSLNLQWKTISLRWCENLLWAKNDNNNSMAMTLIIEWDFAEFSSAVCCWQADSDSPCKTAL